MSTMPTIAALVPMRHHSERIPGKNYRLFAGKPLYHHIVQTLLECPEISQIVIDTDSPVIREDAEQNFPQVTLLERPEHLRAGTMPMNEILMHDVGMTRADLFIQTHSTNPLLPASTISRAIRFFLSNRNSHDSLFSVTKRHVRLWDSDGSPINHDPDILLRTQDLPPIFEENSCIYIFSRESLLKFGSRIGKKPLMFETDPVEAWDIDDETDFILAERLFKCQNPSRSENQ